MKFSEFLNESPLPDSWDKDKYKGRLDFRGMVEYALERSKKIGEGSSRVAFVIDYKGRETVLKIAKNAKGISQNKQEISYLKDSDHDDILIPIIDHDVTNISPRWIHVEKAEEIEDSYFEKECGLPLKDFVLFVYRDVHPPKVLANNSTQKERGARLNRNSPLVKSLYSLFNKHPDLAYGDIARIQNWGLYNGKAVILDIGLDSTSLITQQLRK